MERLLAVWPAFKCILYFSLVLSIILFVCGAACGIITQLHMGYYCVYGGGLWTGFWAFLSSIFGLKSLKFDDRVDIGGKSRLCLLKFHYGFGFVSFICHVILVYLASNDYYYCRAFHLLHGDQTALAAGMIAMAMMVEALLQSKIFFLTVLASI